MDSCPKCCLPNLKCLRACDNISPLCLLHVLCRRRLGHLNFRIQIFLSNISTRTRFLEILTEPMLIMVILCPNGSVTACHGLTLYRRLGVNGANNATMQTDKESPSLAA